MRKPITLALLILSVSCISHAQLFKKVQEIEKLPVSGFAQGPVLSPDGRSIAFSAENYNRALVLNLETKATDEVCAHLGSGWGMRWLDNRRLLVRATKDAVGVQGKEMGLEVIDLDKKTESAIIPFSKTNRIEIPQRDASGRIILRNRQVTTVLDGASPSPKMKSLQKSDRTWTYDGSKILTGTGTINAPGKREILCLIWSPDGTKGLVEVMGQPSLYLLTKSTGRLQLVSEKGEHPSWANNDVYVYMEISDDGHNITTGDIFAASVKNRRRENVTEAFGKVALNPTASADGKIVFNTVDGELYLTKIQIQ